jgi:DNA (cytosine-5)-methyltransferase 1
MAARRLTFIDLFCGCGGFTLGLQRAGLKALAAIDWDPEAIKTLKNNLSDVPLILERDLTVFGPADLGALMGSQVVDVVVGGPPCQGFSTARQRDGANHGIERLIADARRNLYENFLRYVEFFQPRIFVLENVPGIRSAAGGQYFTQLQAEARNLGYRVHPQLEDAWQLGVPQRRRRQLVIGVRLDITKYFSFDLECPARAIPEPPLMAAIGDLPKLQAGAGDQELEYEQALRQTHLAKYGKVARNYLFKVIEVQKTRRLTGHIARPHSARDLRDFAKLREGENSSVAMRDRGIAFEFPYDRSSFKDRYTRQDGSGPCSTIVAHLSKDGLMFIHPKQNRSLTPREAARIQGFPDWFVFPEARTHSFRLIGNAVPPLVAESIGLTIRKFLDSFRGSVPSDRSQLAFPLESSTARNKVYAIDIEVLTDLAKMDRAKVISAPDATVVQWWHAALRSFPEVHPLSALDHGTQTFVKSDKAVSVADPDGNFSERFSRSGWPVSLEPLTTVIARRLKSGRISEEDFLLAQRATARKRDNELTVRNQRPRSNNARKCR